AANTTLTHEGSLAGELETEVARARLRLVELTGRVAQLAAAVEHAQDELRQANAQVDLEREHVRGLEQSVQAAAQALGEKRRQVTADKAEHLEQMRRAAHLQNDAVSYKAQVDNLTRERERLRLRTAQAAESLASLNTELEALTAADAGLQTRLQSGRQALAELRHERERLQHLRDETGELVSRLRQERSGLASRVEVLEGLEQSQEGLGAGVREVLSNLQEPDPGPWRTVIGMIADFLTVKHEYAPLIDLALGEWSQRFLVRDAA